MSVAPVPVATLKTLNINACRSNTTPFDFRKKQLTEISNTASKIANSPLKKTNAKKIIVSEKLRCEFERGNDSVKRDVIRSAPKIRKMELAFKPSVSRNTSA